jgi:hypothetical protein
MTIELEGINRRLKKIECQKNDELLTLVEMLANISFFGDMKKARCDFAKNSQCSYFVLDSKSKGRLPISASCRVKGCKEHISHRHIELTNMTCALCEISSDLTIGDNNPSRLAQNRKSLKS